MFTKIRFKLELYSYYLKKNLPYIFLGLTVGVTAYFLQEPLKDLYQKLNRPMLKIGIEGLFSTTNLPSDITQKISSGLTIIGENDRTSLSPLVNKLNISPDHLQYTFDLNTSAVWHDGKKFSSYDINYQIPGLTFTPDGPNKIVVTSDKAYAPLESLLSRPLFRKKSIGLGTYSVRDIRYQDGRIRYLKLKSASDILIYRFYQDQNDLLNAFKIGEVDQIQITFLPPEFESGWKVAINQNIASSKRYSAIFLNTQKLGNKQLRQSLAYATPKSTDKNERCLSPISPSSWAYNSNVKEYIFNPAKAREFFEPNKIESVNLTVADRNLLITAEDIKKSWEEIFKIKVNVKVENQIDTDNYDALLAYGSVPADPDQYIFWHSTQTKTNLTKINNPKIDKLLEEGRLTFDSLERKKIYQEFQKVLSEESPVIFLQYPTIYSITRNP
ncbi:MAG: ABC transporter substrate-binding protein [Patescibacteria group bacterium]